MTRGGAFVTEHCSQLIAFFSKVGIHPEPSRCNLPTHDKPLSQKAASSKKYFKYNFTRRSSDKVINVARGVLSAM